MPDCTFLSEIPTGAQALRSKNIYCFPLITVTSVCSKGRSQNWEANYKFSCLSLGGKGRELPCPVTWSLSCCLSPRGSCPKHTCPPSSSVQGGISLLTSFCPLIKLGHLYHCANSEDFCWIRAWGIPLQSWFPPSLPSMTSVKLSLLESASLNRKGSPGPYH